MDAIQDPAIFTYKTLLVSAGHTYRYIDQQPPGQDQPVPTVLCLHGFPELAFSWRYQIIHLVHRGYRVIAPDLLGFGGTSKPKEVEAYGKASMCKSLNEILTHEGVSGRITIVSHDWGSVLAARFSSYYPEKVMSWATLCVPPTAPGQLPSGIDYVQMIRKHIPQFGYQIYFMSKESDDEIDRYCQTALLLVYFHCQRGLEKPIQDRLAKFKGQSFVAEGVLQRQLLEVGKELESVTIEDPETAYFVSEMKKDGLSAALNWYRVRMVDQKDEEEAGLPVAFSSEMRCLFIGAPEDAPCPPGMFTEASKAQLFPSGNLDCIQIEGGDHFLFEAPSHRARVSTILGDWIDAQHSPAGPVQSSSLTSAQN